MTTSNGRVLVAYALLQWPWRQTVRDHLYSFRRYGTRPYEYVNLAVPGLAGAYACRRYDAVIWHTSVLAWLRWSPESQSSGSAAGRMRCAPRRRCTSPSRRTSSCTATASTRS